MDLRKPAVNHFWQARVQFSGDVTNIPGLKTDGQTISGPWDAVDLALQRKESKYILPVELAAFDSPNTYAGARTFQNFGINWLLHRWAHCGSAILADEMGLGKTLQSIKAADVKGGVRLVVCPRSVANTWQAEIKKWSNEQTVVNVKTREEAGALVATEPCWLLSSYDLMPYLNPELRATTLIIDEAHNFAGRKAKRGKRLLHFANMAKQRLAITGTPIWSRPRDYWMLFKVLFGSNFGNAWDFDHAYCGAVLNEHGGLENKGATRTRELKHRVSFYQLRRLKRDVAKELPALTRTVRWIEGDPKAAAAMKNAYLHRNKGAQYRALRATLDAKLEPAMDVARDAKSFLLVTSEKKYAQFMQQKLENEGTPCSLLTGDVAPKLRTALIADAAKKRHGIVATIDCIKEGVDGLQHVASTGIVHALDFVPLKLLQMEARLNRIGQKDPVQWIYIMMQESMDMWVNETVVNKLAQWTALFDDVAGANLKGKLQGRTSNQTDDEAEAEVLKQIYVAMSKD